MAFDWSVMRAMMIQAHGIRRADDKFALYYDETNNIRKFLLTDDGTNVAEHKNFVLGGIALQEGQTLPEITAAARRPGHAGQRTGNQIQARRQRRLRSGPCIAQDGTVFGLDDRTPTGDPLLKHQHRSLVHHGHRRFDLG